MDPEVYYSCVTLSVYALVGIIRSFLAFLIRQLDAPDTIIKITENEKSWLVSCATLLTPLGCVFSGILMDLFGRKWFLRAIFVPFTVSWIMISVARNITVLYIAIILQSISTGMSFCVATYVAEISSARRRGALLSVLEITHSIGVVVCYVSMYFFRWNVVSIGFAIFSDVCLVLAMRLPESPIWLYMRDQKDKSIRVLTKLRRLPRDAVEDEILGMEKACAEQTKAGGTATTSNTVYQCLRAWKPLLIVTVMVVMMQNIGYLLMVSYIIVFVNRLNVPYTGSDISIVYSVSGFVASCFTPYTIHNFGIKITLALSALSMGVCMTVIGVYEEIFFDSEEKLFAWIIPAALVVYVFACTLGVYPICFLVGGELFPNEVRGILNGVYGALTYGYGTILSKIYLSYVEFVGIKGTVWTFAGFGFILTLYTIFIIPETRNKSLDQIQEEYFKKKRIKDVES